MRREDRTQIGVLPCWPALLALGSDLRDRSLEDTEKKLPQQTRAKTEKQRATAITEGIRDGKITASTEQLCQSEIANRLEH